MISLVAGLFHQDRLTVHDPDLFREILEQERKKSDAGNILYQHPVGFHDDRFWALCYACTMASHSMAGVVRPAVVIAKSYRLGNLEQLADAELEKALSNI